MPDFSLLLQQTLDFKINSYVRLFPVKMERSYGTYLYPESFLSPFIIVFFFFFWSLEAMDVFDLAPPHVPRGLLVLRRYASVWWHDGVHQRPVQSICHQCTSPNFFLFSFFLFTFQSFLFSFLFTICVERNVHSNGQRVFHHDLCTSTTFWFWNHGHSSRGNPSIHPSFSIFHSQFSLFSFLSFHSFHFAALCFLMTCLCSRRLYEQERCLGWLQRLLFWN